MMKILDKTSKRPYEIVLTQDFAQLKVKVKEVVKPSSILIVTDDHVEGLYLEEVKVILEELAPVFVHTIQAGEASKTLNTVMGIYDTLISQQLDRSSMIVALGGGVVGDIAGFVASSYMRGIPFIQIPTTVVAQNDSSIGGKVGVDYHAHKNMVGAFYQPQLVYININTLKSLEEREFIGGLAEVIKHALIKDYTFYDYLKAHKDKILKREMETLLEMTYRSCQIKSLVVEEDAKEMGIRKILNFGHTIGHAIETLSQFSILHGECVGYGMCMAAHISLKRGFITEQTFGEIVEVCKQYGLLKTLMHYDIDVILGQMKYDKKKLHGKISFILLEQIGKAYIAEDITDEEILQAVLFTEKTCL
ncbi:MAG: 3-dehydroquinate synthase [Cellulosilyticaceae bacterium]